MSAPCKRTCENEAEGGKTCSSDKLQKKTDYELKISNFVTWCVKNNIKLSEKVKISKENVCAQYGMVATGEIEKGECLFEIPRCKILSPDTCGIKKLLSDEAEDLRSPSGWPPLLISVMYEYCLDDSLWRAYLDLCPDFLHLDLPMFWDRCDLERLQGTGVVKAVMKDLESITKEFNDIVLPFVKKHKEHFSSECLDLEFYKKMVAFVMAYSFTEPEKESDHDDDGNSDSEKEGTPELKPPPMMVPVADILNHIADNNAHLVFEKDSLKMVAVKPIQKGCEVFNTYGMLANWQLLHMYGFAEEFPQNHYDTVDIPIKNFYEAAQDLLIHKDDPQLLVEKWNFLLDLGVVNDEGSFIAGMDGILTEEETYQTLKVLTMTRDEFVIHKDKEGWSDEESDHETESRTSLSAGGLSNIQDTWKVILMRSVQETNKKYKTALNEDQEEYSAKRSDLSRRKKYLLCTLIGQKTLLQRMCFLMLVNQGTD